MITFEEAWKTAGKVIGNPVDTCTELESAYIFSSSKAGMSIGGQGMCIILKRDGSVKYGPVFMEQMLSREKKIGCFHVNPDGSRRPADPHEEEEQ